MKFSKRLLQAMRQTPPGPRPPPNPNALAEDLYQRQMATRAAMGGRALCPIPTTNLSLELSAEQLRDLLAAQGKLEPPVIREPDAPPGKVVSLGRRRLATRQAD